MEEMINLSSSVELISDKYNQINKSTGRLFNFFDITRISWKEVQICMFIYELLNPKGRHFQNGKYLSLFCKYVLDIEVTDKQCDNARVYREYLIKNDRRIDIFIEIGEMKIPIEVKIFASDKESQCADYVEYAKGAKLYYLTLHEQMPDEISKKGHDDDIINITFDTQILMWLEKCLEDRQTVQIAPIRENILQFDSVVRNLTGRMEDDKEMDIKELIISSEKNIKSAIDIERSLKGAKTQLLKIVLSDIDIAIGDKLNKLKNTMYSYDADNFKLVNTYYDTKSSKLPGIDYLLFENVKPNVDILLRIEVDYNLFFGLCVVENNERKESLLNNSEIKEIFPKLSTSQIQEKREGCWLYWEFLLNDEQSQTPNFKEFNEIYFSLADEVKRKIFVEKSVEQILNFKNKVMGVI